MASFSRLQLAAALLEYDNDPDNPGAPRKSAYDSAIFAHMRKANGNIHIMKQPPPSPDFLAVKLPSESGPPSEAGVDTYRRSKASIDMLHNPFGGDEEEEQEEEELEVDLKSWGLDSLIPEEKRSKKSKGAKEKVKAKSEILPNTVGVGRRPAAGGRVPHSRTMSMPLAEFGEGGAFLDSGPGDRRNTISDPVNLSEVGVLEKPAERQRLSTHPLIENLPVRPPLHSLSSYEQKRDTVPFPTSSPGPGQNEATMHSDSRPPSSLNALSKDEANPFAIPPPPPSRASRFDPKYTSHIRTMSNATRLSAGPQLAYNDDSENNYSHRAPSRASVLDVRASRDRRTSAASFGTRDMLDDDFQSAYGGEEYSARERRYSRLDLMRPKVLVMPSPLQIQGTPSSPATKITRTKDGFLDSTDGRPLPPGARASRLSVLVPSSAGSVPVPVNSFTPNPRLSLSASQLLFRNSLMVDGQRDVSYNDIDGSIQRAAEDGEQVKLEEPEEPEKPEMTAAAIAASLAKEAKKNKPPGKLYGRSLIDDLEARKLEMRSKQRVFTGDQRPSMMARAGVNRSSALIDPGSLPSRPIASHMPSAQTDTSLSRRGSRGGKPLLEIGDNGQISETNDVREARMVQTKSVFGVDTLWEREMVKLKEIEEQERKEQEEAKRREAEEEQKKAKKKKKKGKGQGDQLHVKPAGSTDMSPSPTSPGASSSVSPHTQIVPAPSLSLPDIPTVTSRKRIIPEPADDDSDYESSASEAAPNQSSAIQEGLVDQWVSDDEKKPVQTPKIDTSAPHINFPPDDDSDEDVPLSVTLQRATQKLASPRIQPDDDDSDEDRPLSMMLLNKSASGSFKLPSSSSEPTHNSLEGNKDDDDDVPLGIRASRLPPGASQLSGISGLSLTGNNDDDRPLSMHPAQMRKSQFQMFAQMQQQQQMLQAQMTNSMLFPQSQSMMFMMPSPQPFTPQPPPPAQEVNKFNSVDRWRHHVAVEGQP